LYLRFSCRICNLYFLPQVLTSIPSAAVFLLVAVAFLPHLISISLSNMWFLFHCGISSFSFFVAYVASVSLGHINFFLCGIFDFYFVGVYGAFISVWHMWILFSFGVRLFFFIVEYITSYYLWYTTSFTYFLVQYISCPCGNYFLAAVVQLLFVCGMNSSVHISVWRIQLLLRW
jgi:hypothetical protein